MNIIKSSFSIKDLENLSGVKAHTIRIWEKRFKLLQPIRDKNNIRSYNIESLQKLLNINMLLLNNFKISDVANMEDSEIIRKVRLISIDKTPKKFAIETLKMSMMALNKQLFNSFVNQLIIDNGFYFVIHEIFFPLLNEIGLLWQSKTISPIHEHFVSNLIMHKIIVQIEKVEQPVLDVNNQKVILFLPNNEFHEIGLLSIYYESCLLGKNCLYLGASTPIEEISLQQFSEENIIFITYFTIYPENEFLEEYILAFQEKFLKNNNKLLIFGNKCNKIRHLESNKIVLMNESKKLSDYL